MYTFLLNPVITAAYHAVSAVAGCLAPVTGSLDATVAIVVFTAVIRLLLHPLTRAGTATTGSA
ncbi:MAG: hypothetical protein ACRDVE_06775 [Actinocrinis sp.]